MATINSYINFPGTAEEAFNFYRSVFGGEFVMVMRYKDSPEAGKVKEAEKDKLMHISLPVGKGNILMATDVLESMGRSFVAGNNFSLSVGADTKEEATNLFNGLSAGGHITMPLADTFWGAYFGMFIDKFGIQWMVNYDHKVL